MIRRLTPQPPEEKTMKNNFVHVELSTDDVKKAEGFYKKLFKWKLQSPKGMDYTMIDTGAKNSGGGIQKKQMAGAPTAWLPYVEVKSVKKTISQAKKLGAEIPLEYMPIEGMGAIGIFQDPAGARLGVYEGGTGRASRG
jgi:predicted enzyme related to lactoylglutathione lyase